MIMLVPFGEYRGTGGPGVRTECEGNDWDPARQAATGNDRRKGARL